MCILSRTLQFTVKKFFSRYAFVNFVSVNDKQNFLFRCINFDKINIRYLHWELLWRKTAEFFCDTLSNKLRKLEKFRVTLILFPLAYLSIPKWAGAPCMPKKSAKIVLDHYSDLSNSQKKIQNSWSKNADYFKLP